MVELRSPRLLTGAWLTRMPHGAAIIAEVIMVRPDGVAVTVTTTMSTAAQAMPPPAGAARLRGITVTEAPTVPEAVRPIGVAAQEAPPGSEAALPRGITAPAPTTGLSAVQVPGIDSVLFPEKNLRKVELQPSWFLDFLTS